MGIYEDIQEERERQNAEWGGEEHDGQHTHRDWCSFIVRKLGNAQQSAEQGHWASYQKEMIQVAALVVADLEVLQRVHNRPEERVV